VSTLRHHDQGALPNKRLKLTARVD